MKALLGLLVFLCAGCGTQTVMIQSRADAKVKIEGVKKVAVLDISCHGQGSLLDSDMIASEVVNQLADAGYYDVIERSRVRQVTDELARGGLATFDSESSARLGKQLQADAVIFGTLNYSVESRAGTTKRNMPTGRFIPQYDPNTGQTIQVPEFQMVDVPTMSKRATVRGDFRMVIVETGRIAASEAEQYSAAAPEGMFGATAAVGEAAIAQLPADADMANTGLQNVVRTFVMKVSPHKRMSERYLIEGESEIVKTGCGLAAKGNWEEAVSRWQAALEVNPGDAAALNNLGVAAERAGDNPKAAEYYQKAVSAAPDNEDILSNKADFRTHVYRQ